MPTKGSVLVLQFGPVPKSYVATSYPHRILDADTNDYRAIHYDNMPRSLSHFLRDFKRDEEKAGKPRYIMNLTTFAPIGSPDWNGATVEDPPGNLWYVYYWKTRAVHQWNAALPPGYLSLLASEFESGSLSHVAFGPTESSQPDCMFLRNTDADESWQYQWTGLPFLCERDCLKHVEGAACEVGRFNGMTEWIGGRLRGVTFGPEGSYIVYRGDKYDWEGAFPLDLREALRKGKDERWSINNCVLNPRNPNEYVLAFNEADDLLRVYYALHQGFAPKFENIIEEWANGKGFSNKYKTFGIKLTDAQCQHNLPASPAQRNSSRVRSSTMVLPQRLAQQPAPASYQPQPQALYSNWTTSPPPLNPGPDRVASPSEMPASMPTSQYPPYGPQVVHPDRDNQPQPAQPIQHIQNYYAGGRPKDGWGKRIAKVLGGDDSNSKGRKK